MTTWETRNKGQIGVYNVTVHHCGKSYLHETVRVYVGFRADCHKTAITEVIAKTCGKSATIAGVKLLPVNNRSIGIGKPQSSQDR